MKVMQKLFIALCLIGLPWPIALTAAETVELGPAKASIDFEGIGPYNVIKEAPSLLSFNSGDDTFIYQLFSASITASNTGNRVLVKVHRMSDPLPLDVPILQQNGKTGLEHLVEISDMMPLSNNVQRQPYYVDGHKGVAFIVNRNQKGPIYLAAYSPNLKDGFGKTVVVIGSDFPLDITKRIFESFKAQLAQDDTAGQSGMGLGMSSMGQGSISSISGMMPSVARPGSRWDRGSTSDQSSNTKGTASLSMKDVTPGLAMGPTAETDGDPSSDEQLLIFSTLPLIVLAIGLVVARLELNGSPLDNRRNEAASASEWAEQLKRSLAIAKKNVRIYYSRGPVVIFGLMFPLVLLVAFTIGRNIGIMELFPGIMGMVIFFASTAMGPGILPWETRSRNLERLVSSPIAVWALFLGDVLASFAFGILISVVPLVIAVAMGVKVANFLVLGLGIVLATFCFASLGILLSVYPPTDVPATVMMVSSLVKFPIVFISGVFVPIGHMHDWGIKIASISPLTYFTDLVTYSITGVSYFSIQTDLAVLVFFTALFLVASIKLHEKFLPQRLS